MSFDNNAEIEIKKNNIIYTKDIKLRHFLNNTKENGMFYLGHASILAVFNGKKILFDPIVLSKPYADSWSFYPPQILDKILFEVDAVIVSHIHQDHYDVHFLKEINKKIPITIIGNRDSFESDLRINGIKNINIIQPDKITEIFKNIFIYGLVHEYNGIDSSCIVFNNEFSLYHGNDNYIETTTMEKFINITPKIDVACIPYAYIHWYPFLLEYDDKKEKEFECEKMPKIQMNWGINATKILNPKIMIPFGANLLLDDGNGYSTMNLAVKTPFEFYDYAIQECPELISIIKPMLAGDYCISNDEKLECTIHNSLKSNLYREIIDKHLKKLPVKIINKKFNLNEKNNFIATLNDRLKSINNYFHNHCIRIDIDCLNLKQKLEINCSTYIASWVDDYNQNVEFHHFVLDPFSTNLWLSGGRFEEVLGTRRFKVIRKPNIYNKEILYIINNIL